MLTCVLKAKLSDWPARTAILRNASILKCSDLTLPIELCNILDENDV